MTDQNLRSILEDAEHAVGTYRRPDVSEAQERLNEVLEAAGLGSTGTDRITSLRIDARHVHVRTAYSVRSCEMDDEFELPVAIVDAPDPVLAATRWGLERKRAGTVEALGRARSSLGELEAELADVEARLAAT